MWGVGHIGAFFFSLVLGVGWAYGVLVYNIFYYTTDEWFYQGWGVWLLGGMYEIVVMY